MSRGSSSGRGINDSTCQEFAFSSIRLIFRPFGNTRPPRLVAARHDFLGVSLGDDRLTSLLENRYQPLKGTSWTNILFRLEMILGQSARGTWNISFLTLAVAIRFGFYRLILQQAVSSPFVSFCFVLYTLPGQFRSVQSER